MSLAKTTRPELLSVLSRERLHQQVDEGVTRSVVWICGPPGAGKTTLIASYLENRGFEHLWYQIDRGDFDVATFFLYLGQAALKLDKRPRKPLPILSPEYAGDLDTFSRRFFRELFSELKKPFVLVLDNYQEVAGASPLHDVIRRGLEEVPKAGCVIITSRTDPPASMARLRANQMLQVIDSEALRLTKDELRALVNVRGQRLGNDAIDMLYQKTQGWAAGVVLMLEHGKARDEPPVLPAGFTPQVIFDYLAGEIFDEFIPATREFLLEVGVLPRMTPEMAQTLTGQTDARALLFNLARNDYFVKQVRSSTGEEYQFHPLFREFLLNRAEHSLSQGRRRELRDQAADLLIASGQIDAAVELLAENDRWDRFAEVVEANARAVLENGRGETLMQWLDSFPERMLTQHPWMIYWSAAVRFHSAPRESRHHYERAFANFRAAPGADPKGIVLSLCGIIDSTLYELDDLSLLDRWMTILEELLASNSCALPKSIVGRATCSLFIAMVLRRPDHPDLESWAERASAIAHSGAAPGLRMTIGPLLALSDMWTGRFAEARLTIDSMRAFAAEREISPLALVTIDAIESMYFMLRGEVDACMQAVERGLQVSTTHGVRLWGNQLLANGVGGLLGAGDVGEARKLLLEVERSGKDARRIDTCLLHYFGAWCDRLEGDVSRAFQQQKRALNLALEIGMPFVEVLCRLAMAELLYECGDERKGQVQLRKVHEIARDIRNPLLEFMALLVYAHIAIKHGKRKSGLNSLRYAMALGREHGYNHFLGWQPSMVTELCMVALEEGIEVDYVRGLVRARGLFPSVPPFQLSAWPWRLKVSVLGAFKLWIDDKPQEFSGKSPARPIELLKVLIALGGKETRAEHLAETLWPHVDGDYAHRSFTITLHRLRKLLGMDEAVVLQDARVSLNPRYVWIDLWAFEHVSGRIDAELRGGSPGINLAIVEELAVALFGAYRGPFLKDESDHPSYIACREHLRGKFLRCVVKLAKCWEEAGEWERALDYYERGIDIDNLSEGFYRHLMICHGALDRGSDAIEAYERCRAALAAALEHAPSAETTTIYQRIVGQR